MQAAQQKAAGEAQMQKTIAEIGETNINNAKERFAKIDELSKKILGPDFKLDETMKNIREKLEGINFSIFSTPEIENNFKTGIGQMNEALTMFSSLGKIASTINEVAANVNKIGNKDKGPIKDLTDGIGNVFAAMGVMNSAISEKVAVLSTSGGNNQIQTSLDTQLASIERVSKGIKDVTTALSGIATTPAAAVKSGIQNMVESMKTLNQGLDEMEKDASLGKIDLRLGRIANSLGIKDAQYTFAHAPVTITMRINVTMDAHELEKVVVNADNSIIRTALNEVAGQPATASVTRTGKPDGSLLVGPPAA
jgi:methyl-accepting chemotaxis protein